MNKVFKATIQKIIQVTGYEIRKTQEGDATINNDASFQKIYQACKEYTMTSPERMYALYQAVKYISLNKIPGEFVECGVWKGGSAMIIAKTLALFNDTQRKIYLYDTFEGMTEPTKDDYQVKNHRFIAFHFWKKSFKKNHSTWCYSSLSEVTANMKLTHYPTENIMYIKGKVEDTIPATMPEKIALLRLDTDWYNSTRHELIHLFPKIVLHGILILDDYGYWAGSQKAVDEYFIEQKENILLQRIDESGRIAIKTSNPSQG